MQSDEKDIKISKLEADLREKEHRVAGLEFENYVLKTELKAIRESFTWKVVMNFHVFFVEFLLPRGTKRRSWYDRMLVFFGRMVNKDEPGSTLEEAFHTLMADHEDLERQRHARFPHEPTISVIVPTYNTSDEFLTAMIESVMKQTYPKWELCIADGRSTKPGVKKLLESYAERDERIKVKFLDVNKGIAGNSNEALSLASGEFVAFLDHDDSLTPFALFEVAKAINRNRNAGFLYSDYMITDEGNSLKQAVYCPDFCRYYFLSHPYIVHLVVVKRSVLEMVGKYDEAMFNEGVSHDVDLYLRIFAKLEDTDIVHIPEVLYLWRHYSRSAGHLFQHKVHTFTKAAIKRYLDAMDMDAAVEDGITFNTFRIRVPIKEDPKVSIIIPTKDNWELLKKCIGSIEKKAGYQNYEILVIRNNTTDRRALEYLEGIKGKHAVIEYSRPFNFSAINNFAVKSAHGDYLLFLNDDIEFKGENTLRSALELLQLEDVGVVGAKLLYPDNTIQHAGVIVGLRGVAEHWHKFINANINRNLVESGYMSSLVAIREYADVTGAFLMTKKHVFEEVKGFSEELKVGFNDVDYCLKVLSGGYKVLFTPYALAYHYESVSRRGHGRDSSLAHPEDEKIFAEKWRGFLSKGDPFYNPNLDNYSYVPIPRLLRSKTAWSEKTVSTGE